MNSNLRSRVTGNEEGAATHLAGEGRRTDTVDIDEGKAVSVAKTHCKGLACAAYSRAHLNVIDLGTWKCCCNWSA